MIPINRKNIRFVNNDNKRLHFYHIPKTGGRSVVAAIGGVAYPELKGKEIYRKIVKQQIDSTQEYISCATYDFGEFFLTYGHTTFKELNSPRMVISKDGKSLVNQIGLHADCFTFTVFRDPVERMFSRYKEYVEEISSNIKPSIEINITDKTIEEFTFIEFIKSLPTHLLYEQLYYFSNNDCYWYEDSNIKKSVKNTLSLDKVCFLHTIKNDIKYVSKHIKKDIILGERFERKTKRISEQEKIIATKLLKKEYDFLNAVKKGLNL